MPTSTGDSEYDSLISDLKRDAAARRTGQPVGESSVRDDDSDDRADSRPGRDADRAPADRGGRGNRPPRGERRDRERSRPPREAEAEREEAERPSSGATEPAVAEPASSNAGTEETAAEQEPDRLADFGAGIL